MTGFHLLWCLRKQTCQFTIKVPDSDRVNGQACLARRSGIGRADPYEQAGRQPGLRIRGQLWECQRHKSS